MAMIPEQHKKRLEEEFRRELEKPMKIAVFTQEVECPYCAQTRSLIEELSALNSKISVEVYDFLTDSAKAREYGVDKVPAVAITGEKDYGIRFYGLPYGYELQTLIESIIYASKGKTDLSEGVKEKLKRITKPVHIQVFVTLTCPYCPAAAIQAYKFAIENTLVRADVVEVSEFPHLAYKYGVMGVPKTVINEKVEFLGAGPEELLMEHVLLAVQQP
ncbi:MAG: thioredoxin family protein [Candidatus Bathyarchaeota archaeon]|nr:thioredoxin family protein [Candidatus Bathyarchaeota archaeon]